MKKRVRFSRHLGGERRNVARGWAIHRSEACMGKRCFLFPHMIDLSLGVFFFLFLGVILVEQSVLSEFGKQSACSAANYAYKFAETCPIWHALLEGIVSRNRSRQVYPQEVIYGIHGNPRKTSQSRFRSVVSKSS